MQIKMAEEEIQGNQSSNVIEEQSSACPGTVAENASGESLAFTAGTSEMYSNIRSEKPHVADSEQKWECMSSTPVALALEPSIPSPVSHKSETWADVSPHWKRVQAHNHASTPSGHTHASASSRCPRAMLEAPGPSRVAMQGHWFDDLAESRLERRKIHSSRSSRERRPRVHPKLTSGNSDSTFKKSGFFKRLFFCSITDIGTSSTPPISAREQKQKRQIRNPFASNERASILPSRTRSEPETSNRRMLPVPPKKDAKPCLVLDLDETLVHSSFKSVECADFIIDISVQGQPFHIHVIKRPFVDEFLKVLSQKYEIGVFTASVKEYADEVVSRLNTDGAIQWTLYRESCTLYKGQRVKDLRRLRRLLSRTVIVDDKDTSFLFQPANGIECLPFFGDPEDTELRALQRFLLDASDLGGDVTQHLSKWDEY
eukprot:gb/GECG01003054.1/.p1 GENE.gb/GECG01003054.1/~~gb/GECG01003054.1/.p1  ORF type:complete len:429 (+),score=54.48 gb/GECG01003054.1/:1-1287(+)